jgi:hypothetical protein
VIWFFNKRFAEFLAGGERPDNHASACRVVTTGRKSLEVQGFVELDDCHG